MEKYAEQLGEYQCGFRKARSTIYQIYTLKQLQSSCREHNIDLHVFFIDYKHAYDTVIRKEVYKTMKELHIPNKLVILTQITIQSTRSRVKIQGRLSDSFDSNKGLRQGNPISSLLFNLTLEKVVRTSNSNRQGTILHKDHQCLAYTDDLTLIIRSKTVLKDIFTKLEKPALKLGLSVNEDKTKYMFLSRKANTGRNLQIISQNNKKYLFEQVQEFKFLGVMITREGNNTKEIITRIANGNKCVGALNKMIKSNTVSKATKIRIYKTIIRPTVVYASETWTLNKSEQNKLARWERKVVRRTMGGKKEDRLWRRRTNREVQEDLQGPDII